MRFPSELNGIKVDSYVRLTAVSYKGDEPKIGRVYRVTEIDCFFGEDEASIHVIDEKANKRDEFCPSIGDVLEPVR